MLEFVCILRHDGGGWAIPGGMVDAGEVISTTLKREFMEEALNSNLMSPQEKEAIKTELGELFSAGLQVYVVNL